MKPLPSDMKLVQAMRLRMFEARRALVMIENGLKHIEDMADKVSWGDFGSLSHSVEQMEEAAVALGVSPEEFSNPT